MFGTNTHHLGRPLEGLNPGDRATLRFRFDAALGPGSYSVAVALHSTDTHVVNNFEWRDLALVFNVVNMSQTNFLGSAWLPPDLVIERATGPSGTA